MAVNAAKSRPYPGPDSGLHPGATPPAGVHTPVYQYGAAHEGGRSPSRFQATLTADYLRTQPGGLTGQPGPPDGGYLHAQRPVEYCYCNGRFRLNGGQRPETDSVERG